MRAKRGDMVGKGRESKRERGIERQRREEEEVREVKEKRGRGEGEGKYIATYKHANFKSIMICWTQRGEALWLGSL